MIYRPTVELLEEILERDTFYGGILGFLSWHIIAITLAPYVAVVLLKNDNDDTIQGLAGSLAEKILEEE
jgi:hypothetical protein